MKTAEYGLYGTATSLGLGKYMTANTLLNRGVMRIQQSLTPGGQQLAMAGGGRMSPDLGVRKEDVMVRSSKGTEKVPSKNNYRSLYLDENPFLPKGWQVHHTLPQKYEEIIKKSGINIHEVKYLRGVDPKVHSKITNEWTKWDKALGRTPTAKEIRNFAKQIDQKYNKYWH